MQTLSVRAPSELTRMPFPPGATLGDVLDALGGDKATPLVFAWENQQTTHGYHITEIKSGQFSGLDCGANTESWTEVFIQLWNVDGERDSQTMTVGKARSILSVVEQRIGLDRQAKLTFEVSDGNSTISLYRPAAVRKEAGRIVVELAPAPSSCKPRDRWLAGTPTVADTKALSKSRAPSGGCCGSAGPKAAC